MSDEYNWYILLTRSGVEEEVTELLMRKNIIAYCPMHKLRTQSIEESIKNLKIPLFVSNVFVFIRESDFAEVKRTKGILNLLFWLNKPAIVLKEDISAIKRTINHNEFVYLEKTIITHSVEKIVNAYITESFPGDVRKPTRKTHLSSLGYYLINDRCESLQENLRNKSQYDFHEEVNTMILSDD